LSSGLQDRMGRRLASPNTFTSQQTNSENKQTNTETALGQPAVGAQVGRHPAPRYKHIQLRCHSGSSRRQTGYRHREVKGQHTTHMCKVTVDHMALTREKRSQHATPTQIHKACTTVTNINHHDLASTLQLCMSKTHNTNLSRNSDGTNTLMGQRTFDVFRTPCSRPPCTP
jgi:hypothetical protein